MARRVFILAVAAALLVPSVAVALSTPTPPLAVELGLDAPQSVTITRDPYGVPHIYADTLYALFWGNGYAQAQDRLFQMDVLRHVGKGESARFLGPSQLEMDLATRRELYTDAERTARWESLPADERETFQGFADGVNAWIAKTRADPTLLSAEFYAIGHAPEDWAPEDTIAIAEFLLDIFGAGSGGNEQSNAQLLQHLLQTVGSEGAEAAFGDLLPMHDAETYVTIPADEYTYAATEGPLDFDDIPLDQWEVTFAAANAEPFGGGKSLQEAAQSLLGGFKFGSNALVVSPQYAESGNALLLGGPQMAYHNPMIPYELALHGAGYDALGMGVGGAPGVIIGRTSSYAWTVTSGSSDQVDVVAVKLVEGNPRQYYVEGYGGAVADMACRDEVHFGPPTAIDQNPPVLATQEVCRTVYGPVFAINDDARFAFARERTHRGDELRSGILWLTLGTATTLEEFQQHMETFRFEFNFHVATDDGHIAYFHWGANPQRDARCDPRLPRLAGMCDWDGFRTGSALPHIIDPEKGYLVNWNNKPAQGWSGGDALEKWGPVHRAELFERTVQDFLTVDGTLSEADLKAINEEISTRSPFPRELAPHLLAATSGATGVAADARAALDAWVDDGGHWLAPDATCKVAKRADACFGTYEPGFAVYETWRGIIQERAFADEMGVHMRTMGFNPPETSDPHAADHGREDNKDNTLFNALRGETRHAWCDDVTTLAEESCDDLLRATFHDAVETLRAEYGDDVSTWRQDARTIKFVGLSGGPAWNIHMVNRPSFNHYYDFGTGAAGSVLPPGTNQYWMPLDFLRYSADGTMPDAHKRDQLDLYVDFAYKPAQMTPAWIDPGETIILN